MTFFGKNVIYIPKFALVFEECAYWVGPTMFYKT